MVEIMIGSLTGCVIVGIYFIVVALYYIANVLDETKERRLDNSGVLDKLENQIKIIKLMYAASLTREREARELLTKSNEE